jgi:hypothetical protein
VPNTNRGSIARRPQLSGHPLGGLGKSRVSSSWEATFPCPACGFVVFAEPSGSYDICPICGWEDDHVQLRYPSSTVGANSGASLLDYQRRVIHEVPPEVQHHRGFLRDPLWRPLTEEEARAANPPQDGRSYFEAAAEDSPPYYWRQ